MKRITINPQYPIDIDDIDPADVIYPILYFLIDDQHALSTNGLIVDLVRVVPDEADPGAYRVAEGYEHITVAMDDERTIAGLDRIVQQLRSISAYELLTQKFYIDRIAHESMYLVNRDTTFQITTELAEDTDPVNVEGATDGKDY